eukprot:8294831-Prorocentrum_lima.AAC.2
MANLGQSLEPSSQPQLQLFRDFTWVPSPQPHANDQLGTLFKGECLAPFPVMHSARADFQKKAAVR